MRRYANFIGGRFVESSNSKKITFPFNDEAVATAGQADAEQMEKALESAHESFRRFSRVSRYTRARLLERLKAAVESKADQFVQRLIEEAGKPKALAEGEFNRALFTLTVASREVLKFAGEMVPFDIDAAGRAYDDAEVRWFPRGPVLAITPFNFPLNLVLHKIAPAFAVGASVIVKPPPQAPGCSILLAECFEQAARELNQAEKSARDHIPLEAFQVVSSSNEIIAKAVTDPRIGILSFTGSDKVGWMLQGQAVRKKVLLELGGNAAVIVHEDADLSRAAVRSAFGGFAYAGQTCISVQRIYAHQKIAAAFTEKLVAEVAKIKAGDPREAGVSVGPLIDDTAVKRIGEWLGEAKKDGAKILTGGKFNGRVLEPTVLTGVKPENKLSCEEVFGPIVIIEKYDKIENAFERVNDSRFGLQAGVFTESSRVAREAFETLEVGGVIINDVPTYRADHMPYGGVKDSGLGREGLRYAMEDYCERRIMVAWKGN